MIVIVLVMFVWCWKDDGVENDCFDGGYQIGDFGDYGDPPVPKLFSWQPIFFQKTTEEFV